MSGEAPDGFVYRFVPPAQPGAPGSGLTLLLLHGTGGDEEDLLPLGHDLAPASAMLGVRGRVLENGMPRFFRRLRPGVFDLDDLRAQTHALHGFLDSNAPRLGIARSRLVAVGYSNGANVAASLLLLHPGALAGAVLFRAMVPFVPDAAPALGGLPVLLAGGRHDPIVAADHTETLAAMLTGLGAQVELHWHGGGHELGEDDVEAARAWLSRRFAAGGHAEERER